MLQEDQPRQDVRPDRPAADAVARGASPVANFGAMPLPKSRFVVFFSIAVVGCALDLATKSWVFSWLGYPPREVYWLWPDILSLETSLNEGALFGIGQGQVVLFSILSILAALAIFSWLFYLKAAHDRLLNVALASVTAGIFGNLYDRLGLPGLDWPYANQRHEVGDRVFAVRDWIHFQCPWFDWPIFNIADSMLVCGAALLLWHAFRTEQVG